MLQYSNSVEVCRISLDKSGSIGFSKHDIVCLVTGDLGVPFADVEVCPYAIYTCVGRHI